MQNGQDTQATRIELPFWPSSTNNLSWSADNLIAVGGGDSLAILVPRLTVRGQNFLQWDSIVHHVNYFSIEEVPMPELLGIEQWSAGEELSLRHITDLEWSPPGLGKFGSCVLAVLHSNHILTLWECVGRPHVKYDWKRCSIVNKAIAQFYADLYETSTPEQVAEQQVRRRIRAFTWLPPIRKKCDLDVRGIDDYVGQGEHHLAVSTEGGDIFLLSVKSPHDLLDPDRATWTVSVVGRLTASPDSVTSSSDDRVHERRSPAIADSIAGSDMIDGRHIYLAFVTQGQLIIQALQFQELTDQQEYRIELCNKQTLPGHHDLIGPIKFVPRSSSLVVFGPDKIIRVDASRGEGILTEQAYHHLDGRWDEISGLAFTSGPFTQPSINLTSHVSTTQSDTATLSANLHDEPHASEPEWLHGIRESKANFSATYDLAGNVQERTWGIASSPLGDHVATCISMLPSDSPAHVISSDQWSVVAITADWWDSNDKVPVNGGRSVPHDVTAESLVFSLRQQIMSKEENLVKASPHTAVSQLISTLGLDNHGLDSIAQSEINMPVGSIRLAKVEYLIRYSRAQVYYHPTMLPKRLERLVKIATQEQPETPQFREVYQHLITVILTLAPHMNTSTTLSQAILGAYRSIQTKLHSSYGIVQDEESVLEERCSICGDAVAFESLRWSRCARGHQFKRCSLTFLSILEPGKSKSCKVCNTQYLNEHTISVLVNPTQGGDGNDEDKQEAERPIEEGDVEASTLATLDFERQLSLARILFAACDKCIFCGGKFSA